MDDEIDWDKEELINERIANRKKFWQQLNHPNTQDPDCPEFDEETLKEVPCKNILGKK